MHKNILLAAASGLTLLSAATFAQVSGGAPGANSPTQAEARPADMTEAQAVAAIRSAALSDDQAWNFTEQLTTQVGPRQGGTPAEARGRAWATAYLTAAGFQHVRDEPFMMPTWVRGEERAEIVTPYRFNLAVTALGNSAATVPQGIEGAVRVFSNLAEFEAAPDDQVRGQIVYIGHQMRRTQDGSSYGQFGRVRFVGPAIAARRGARAIIIRSVGTDSHRNPHTGNTNFPEGVAAIPSAAISNPDADQLERLGSGTVVRLALTPRNLGQQQSGNVIAEIPGTDPAAGVIVAACHLDSWDLGTGAIDDAVGCGIIQAAALRAASLHRPRRTIRLLLAGAEEVGVWGGAAYGRDHGRERHAAALESDFGAGRVWRVDFRLPTSANALADRIAAGLMPLGIGRGRDAAGGGADIGALAEAGVPLIDLQQDGTRYFDLHHTPDDTLDKIDKQELRQNVAAWAVTLYLLANAPEELPDVPRS